MAPDTARITLPLLFFSAMAWLGASSWDTCETIDGDCIHNCTRITAKIPLSCEPELVRTATEAEAVLADIAANASSPIEFDDPQTGLHSSLFYFCCHDVEEIGKMGDVLEQMVWSSFEINFDDVACNLDHNNKTIYLHALPTEDSKLFALARQIEDTLIAAGIPIYHPRKSKFHMTLARVTYSYPVDYAMGVLRGKEFGRHQLCSFEFDDITAKSSDYEACNARSDVDTSNRR